MEDIDYVALVFLLREEEEGEEVIVEVTVEEVTVEEVILGEGTDCYKLQLEVGM